MTLFPLMLSLQKPTPCVFFFLWSTIFSFWRLVSSGLSGVSSGLCSEADLLWLPSPSDQRSELRADAAGRLAAWRNRGWNSVVPVASLVFLVDFCTDIFCCLIKCWHAVHINYIIICIHSKCSSKDLRNKTRVMLTPQFYKEQGKSMKVPWNQCFL